MPRLQRHSRARHRDPNLSLAPVFLFVLLMGGGLAAAGFMSARKKALEVHDADTRETQAGDLADPGGAAGETILDRPAQDPWDGVRDARWADLRASNGSQPRKPTVSPTAGLESDPMWLEALVFAQDGELFADKARAAKQRGDHKAYNQAGKSAKLAFDQALQLSAQFELDAVRLHGDRDASVRKIIRARTDWLGQLQLFHRTTGR